MLAGGNALEEYATRRAGRELTPLLERMPRIAHVRRGDAIEEMPVEDVRAGDIVVVRAGEVAAGGRRRRVAHAVVDESALTGEPLPVDAARGGRSGAARRTRAIAFDLRATRPARTAPTPRSCGSSGRRETERAPFVRLADRYAAVFLPLALAVAGGAWAASGSSTRFLAVMVVATPCPLILAAPIAFIAGVSRAARRGVIVKSGGVIERLGEARTVLLDKTGTLTLGLPGDRARRRVRRARPRRARCALPPRSTSSRRTCSPRRSCTTPKGAGSCSSRRKRVEEGAARASKGRSTGRRVAVGSAAWLQRAWLRRTPSEAARTLDGGLDAGTARILVGVDGALAGAVVMGDHVRADAHGLVDELHAAGIRHVAMATGDRAAVADAVGAALGVDRVYAEQSPEDKLEIVRALRATPLCGRS